ncbi:MULTISPECIES: helix-turn-helix domain-containing protein [Enterococcus]|nr:helix-turn-helix domain-containing protein [Enterococcus faecium]
MVSSSQLWRICYMLKQGIPVAEIAEENGLSRPTIYKIKKANDL